MQTMSQSLERKIGAGSRDRTGILSLEGCCTTIVLYPRRAELFSRFVSGRREGKAVLLQLPERPGDACS